MHFGAYAMRIDVAADSPLSCFRLKNPRIEPLDDTRCGGAIEVIPFSANRPKTYPKSTKNRPQRKWKIIEIMGRKEVGPPAFGET